MKKFLSILLTATMIVGVFTFGVSAAATPIIGNGANDGSTNNGSFTDGVENFDNKQTTAKIELTIQEPQDRYAVDIEFGNLIFTMSGGLEWNVDSHSFQANSELPSIETTVTLTNHSSKSVYWLVKPEAADTLNSVIKFVCDNDLASYSSEVADAQTGNPGTETVTVTLKKIEDVSDTDVLNAFANSAVDHTVTLGTITVTVSMNTLQTDS